MKKLLILLALFFSPEILIANAKLTTRIASKMGYYDYIKSLRVKAASHLNILAEKMNRIVNDMKAHGWHRKSYEIHDYFDVIYSRYADKINAAFEQIDKRIVLGGDALDDANAPTEEKIALIRKVKANAQNIINSLLKKHLRELEIENYNY